MTPSESATVARLETRVEDLAGRMDRFDVTCSACRAHNSGGFAHVYEKVDKLSDRLRALELRVAFWSGAAALVGTIGGAVVTHLVG